jgi:3-mercaptopyruvate sulfurtransferase SseA
MGLRPVAHIKGGFGAWKAAGAPVDLSADPKSNSR